LPRQLSITLANVICRFGDHLFLLDLAKEVVFPAFADSSLRRKYGETVYLFLNTGWITTPAAKDFPAEICLYGQIVKDTVLHREQILRAGQLVPSPESLPSAPSAFFVLLLSNHKLIYLPETSGAPALDAFGATLQSFLREKHRDYITALYEAARVGEKPVTKSSLLEQIPVPTVEVVPLATRESINDFVSSIEKLTHLEFRILTTNREFQMRGPYQRIRTDAEALGAKSSKLMYDNAEGMSKPEVTNQIELAAATGNQTVVLAGVSEDGTKVRGNNDKFKMQIPAPELPAQPQQKSRRLLDIFRTQAANGNIALDVADDSRERIRALERSLGDGNGGTAE
jgi:hypothetical protein